MPAPKNTTKRYKIIDRCFNSKGRKYWSAEALIQKLADKDIRINARTLRYDIETMKFDEELGYLAPIEYCKTNKGYHYADPDYSIDKFNLSDEQLQSLDFVVDNLHEYQDLKVMKEFNGIIDKLAGIFKQIRNRKASEYIEYEKVPYYKGIELRNPIIDAIRNKNTLTIKYTTYERSYPIKHIMHPYLLKEYDNSWYLIGLLHSKQKPMTLALDRMDGIAAADVDYLENTYFNPKEYFQNILGITFTQGPVEEIILEVTPFLANYLKAKHLHASQQIIKEDKTGARIRLKLIVNHELIQLILGYGRNMTVIKPESLKQTISENLTESLKKYE